MPLTVGGGGTEMTRTMRSGVYMQKQGYGVSLGMEGVQSLGEVTFN